MRVAAVVFFVMLVVGAAPVTADIIGGPPNACSGDSMAPGGYVYRCDSGPGAPTILLTVNAWVCEEDLDQRVEFLCQQTHGVSNPSLESKDPRPVISVDIAHQEWEAQALQPGAQLITSKPDWWTDWFNRDKPGGKGDYETLKGHLDAGLSLCKEPIGIECRTAKGIVSGTKGLVCNVSKGGYCINSEYPGGRCPDLSVRYLCPGQETVQKMETAQLCPGWNPLVGETVPAVSCLPNQILVSTPKPGMCICTASTVNSTH